MSSKLARHHATRDATLGSIDQVCEHKHASQTLVDGKPNERLESALAEVVVSREGEDDGLD